MGSTSTPWCRVLIFLAAALPALAGKEADEVLLKACEAGNLKSAAKALQEGADPNAKGSWRGAPALHIALGEGNKELVELLVKSGADVLAKAENGDTILHAVSGAQSSFSNGSWEQALELMRWALDKGISVNVENEDGGTPLEIASRTSPALVQLLLERGAVASPQALAAALDDGSRLSVDLLLNVGADPKAPLPKGRTMLHALSTSSSRYEQRANLAGLFDLLVDKGLELERPDTDGWTPLLAAATVPQSSSIDWLLKHGANPKAVDTKGRTALMLLADSESDPEGGDWNADEIARLCAAGCPVNAVDGEGRSALDRTFVRQKWNSLSMLVRAGAVVPWPREILRDALLAWRENPAMASSMRSLVRPLLAEAVKPPALLVDRRPLLHELVFFGDPYLMDLALRLGAKPDEPDATGQTALMWAAAFKSDEMKALLIKAGADPAKEDAAGMTAEYRSALAAASVAAMAGPWTSPSWPENKDGALEEALERQQTEVVRTCLKEGKTIKLGMLSSAAMVGNVEIASLLLAYGAKPNEVYDTEENTPAHLAASSWRVELMDVLVKAGADLNLKNKLGRAVAQEAKEAGYVEWAGQLAAMAAGK